MSDIAIAQDLLHCSLVLNIITRFSFEVGSDMCLPQNTRIPKTQHADVQPTIKVNVSKICPIINVQPLQTYVIVMNSNNKFILSIMNIKKNLLQKQQQQRPFIVLQKLISSKQGKSWFLIRQLTNKHYEQHELMTIQFSNFFTKNYNKAEHILSFLFISTLTLSRGQTIQAIFLKRRWQQLVPSLQQLSEWLSTLNNEQKNQSIEIIIENVPKMWVLSSCSQKQLYYILRCLDLWYIRTKLQLNIFSQFFNSLINTQVRTKQPSSIIYIIVVVIELASLPDSMGNVALLLDTPLINLYKHHRQKSQSPPIVVYVDRTYQSWLKKSIQTVVRLFKNLFRFSPNLQNLTLLRQLTKVYLMNEQYNMLIALYQQVILLELAFRSKCSLIESVSELIFDIVAQYSIGLMDIIAMNKKAFSCLYVDVCKVQSKNIRGQWIHLCFLVAENNPVLLASLQMDLKSQNIELQLIIQAKKMLFQKYQSWQVSSKDLIEKKQIKKQRTIFKGIKNTGVQCFIISVVQALYNIQQFRQCFLRQKFKEQTAAFQLGKIFLALKNNEQVWAISLRNKSCRNSAIANKLQDAYIYLTQLFKQIESQIVTNRNISAILQKLFKIEILFTIECKVCSKFRNQKQIQFSYTMQSTKQFDLLQIQKVYDYECQQCRSSNAQITSQIYLTGNCLIIHLNRFKKDKNAIFKQLQTGKIKRFIDNLQLKGIIFYVGRNTSSGHYIYYSKINSKAWLEFDDNIVKRLQLKQDNEQFQNFMKSSYTPYILFYQKSKAK